MRVQRTARACLHEGAISPDTAVASSPEHLRAHLLEYYSHLIAEAGADFAFGVEVPFPGAARQARRVARQSADHLVRVLSASHRANAVSASMGVAA